MTKYVLVLKNQYIIYIAFLCLQFLKNKQMKIKSNYKDRSMHVDRELTKNQSTD